MKLFGEEIEVRASIVNLPGISGHADKNQLTEWLGAIKNKPEHVFIVHGEETTAESFANHVHETFGYDAVAPYSGDAYDLITNQKGHTNPLFMGFLGYQNVNKEIIQPNIEKEQQTPENPVFSGFSLYSENLSDTFKTHENVPVTNR